MVDEFILYDDMQYTKRDWRNRNKIKTSKGSQWLTIPIQVKGKYLQKINQTEVLNNEWREKHWKMLKQNYSKSKYFNNYKEIFEEFYLTNNEEYLSKINYEFIVLICKILGIKTKIKSSKEFTLVDGQTQKLLGICKETNADIYLSGAAAKSYFDEELAKEKNIKVEWMDYSNYEEYKQLFLPFEHGVSVLDLIFNEGPNATKYMKSFKS